MTQQIQCLDPNEAPEGYYAILKTSILGEAATRNLCWSCDWHEECKKPTTDLARHDHRCSSAAVITNDGRRIERKDGCSVLFKRRPVITPEGATIAAGCGEEKES